VIPTEVITDILDRVSLSDIVGRYTEVKKSGRNAMALCPFHSEKTPSFSISDEKGLYHCFGCGASGNAIKFLKDHARLSFIDAVKELAVLAGVDVSGYDNKASGGVNREREKFLKINIEAMQLYHKNLYSPEGKMALGYLTGRKLTEEIIKKYRLGYGGSSRSGITGLLMSAGCSESDIVSLSLALNGGNGIIDKFSGRVIFPILDKDGNVVGFGGRILTNDRKSPKYLNSAENILFHKGKILYSLNFAKEAMVKSGEVFIVEGYMDVIALNQHGIENVCAPLGTSLTVNHLETIKRYCHTVIYIFDGDEAGINAANRSLDISVNSSLEQKVVILPLKNDPYDFVMASGRDKFIDYVQQRKLSPIDFKLKYFFRNDQLKKNKVRFLQSVFSYISRIDSSVTRADYLKRTSDFLHEGYETINSEYQNFRGGKNITAGLRKSSVLNEVHLDIENEFIKLLIDKPGLINELRNIVSMDMFLSDDVKKIYNIINNNPAVTYEDIIESGSRDILKKTWINNDNIPSQTIEEYAWKIRQLYFKRKMDDNNLKMLELQRKFPDKPQSELTKETISITREINDINNKLSGLENIE